MSEDFTASVLFPNDAAPKSAPDWYRVERGQAEARLMGARTKPAADPAADAAQPGKQEPDAAAIMFGADKPDYAHSAREAVSFLELHADNAKMDGDHDRAQALNDASAALMSDFSAAGTSAEDVNEAFAIVRERTGDMMFGNVAPEKLNADQASAMEALTAQGVTSSDLDAARAFIRDLETISPGVVRSLETTGAGNDLRLIEKAIREARRRGY